MALSYDLISQFAKLTAAEKKTSSESTVYGIVKVDDRGNKYVQLDGSDQLTPIAEDEQPSIESTSANVNEGERVSVLIKNHTATVTGNISSPAARTGDVKDLDDKVTDVQKFGILVGEKVEANSAYFKKLIADEAILGELEAAKISVTDLLAKKADISSLIAGKATISDLIAKKIDADIIIADEAILNKLKADEVDVLSLIADKAVIEELVANNADLNSLEAKNAYLKFANIDFSNIDKAAIEELFSKSGLIEDLVVGDGTITGTLVGVTIKGDTIQGGTVVADKLVVKGEDGLYYKLNFESGNFTDAEEVPTDGLHGSVIVANSITAEKVNVHDLVAFGATIGGFHIKDDAIHSGVKESIDNTTLGVYLDKEGQMSIGDNNNYIKYYKTPEEGYKLNIAVDNIQINGNPGVSDLLNSIRINPNEPSITIGVGKNAMSLLLRNDTISFVKDGNQFGWWDGVDFHTGNIVVDVTERAQFGNFAMVPRSDGSLSFLKVTDNTGFYAYVGSGVMTFYGSYPILDVNTLIIEDVAGELEGTTLILGGQ